MPSSPRCPPDFFILICVSYACSYHGWHLMCMSNDVCAGTRSRRLFKHIPQQCKQSRVAHFGGTSWREVMRRVRVWCASVVRVCRVFVVCVSNVYRACVMREPCACIVCVVCMRMRMRMRMRVCVCVCVCVCLCRVSCACACSTVCVCMYASRRSSVQIADAPSAMRNEERARAARRRRSGAHAAAPARARARPHLRTLHEQGAQATRAQRWTAPHRHGRAERRGECTGERRCAAARIAALKAPTQGLNGCSLSVRGSSASMGPLRKSSHPAHPQSA